MECLLRRCSGGAVERVGGQRKFAVERVGGHRSLNFDILCEHAVWKALAGAQCWLQRASLGSEGHGLLI